MADRGWYRPYRQDVLSGYYLRALTLTTSYVFVLLLPAAVSSAASSDERLALAGVLVGFAVALAAMWRAALVGVFVNDEGVRVRRLLHVTTHPWHEVNGFSAQNAWYSPLTGPNLVLLLEDGREIRTGWREKVRWFGGDSLETMERRIERARPGHRVTETRHAMTPARTWYRPYRADVITSWLIPTVALIASALWIGNVLGLAIGGQDRGTLTSVALFGASGMAVLVLWRAATCGVLVNDDAVRLRRVTRTATIPWKEVTAFETTRRWYAGVTGPELVIARTDGSAIATGYRGDKAWDGGDPADVMARRLERARPDGHHGNLTTPRTPEP